MSLHQILKSSRQARAADSLVEVKFHQQLELEEESALSINRSQAIRLNYRLKTSQFLPIRWDMELETKEELLSLVASRKELPLTQWMWTLHQQLADQVLEDQALLQRHAQELQMAQIQKFILHIHQALLLRIWSSEIQEAALDYTTKRLFKIRTAVDWPTRTTRVS